MPKIAFLVSPPLTTCYQDTPEGGALSITTSTLKRLLNEYEEVAG